MKDRVMQIFAKTVVFLPYGLVFGSAGLAILYSITSLAIIENIFSVVVQSSFILTIVSFIVYVSPDAIYGTETKDFE